MLFFLQILSHLYAQCQLPEAPTLGWRDESLMASDFNIGVQYLHFVYSHYIFVCISLLVDVSCLKLPPSGGVTSR